MTDIQRHPTVGRILGCALRIHKALGPGLLESTYGHCLTYEFTVHGIRYLREVPVPVHYHDVDIKCGYRVDYVVEDTVLLEIKSVPQLTPLHYAQVLTYMRLMNMPRGLLINFNARYLMGGVKSLILKSPAAYSDESGAVQQSGAEKEAARALDPDTSEWESVG
jgi:GxxExxY protein